MYKKKRHTTILYFFFYLLSDVIQSNSKIFQLIFIIANAVFQTFTTIYYPCQ